MYKDRINWARNEKKIADQFMNMAIAYGENKTVKETNQININLPEGKFFFPYTELVRRAQSGDTNPWFRMSQETFGPNWFPDKEVNILTGKVRNIGDK